MNKEKRIAAPLLSQPYCENEILLFQDVDCKAPNTCCCNSAMHSLPFRRRPEKWHPKASDGKMTKQGAFPCKSQSECKFSCTNEMLQKEASSAILPDCIKIPFVQYFTRHLSIGETRHQKNPDTAISMTISKKFLFQVLHMCILLRGKDAK